MNYIYIFDYSVGEIFEIETNRDDITNEIAEDIITDKGFDLSNCYYMIVESKLKINEVN